MELWPEVSLNTKGATPMAVDSLLPLRRTARILALIMQGLLLTTGCTSWPKATAARGTDTVIFVDFSGSIRNEAKALFRQDIETWIIPSL